MLIDLQKITTRDGMILNGGVVWPLLRRGFRRRQGSGGQVGGQAKTAVVFVHGLTGNFYNWFPRAEALVHALTRRGFAVAIFNTRGHDVVSRVSKVASTRGQSKKHSLLGGSAMERFEDCIHDIRAVIDFLSRNGYRRIVLLGHSTGANKVAYYAGTHNDRRVRKVVLLAPIADPVVARTVYGRSLSKYLREARHAVRRGQGNVYMTRTASDPPATPKHFLSLNAPGGCEDVFPYYNPKGNWRTMKNIRVPVLAVVGDHDQYLDRDTIEYMEAFEQHVPTFRGIIIPDADHSFNKREKELARVVTRFITHET